MYVSLYIVFMPSQPQPKAVRIELVICLCVLLHLQVHAHEHVPVHVRGTSYEIVSYICVLAHSFTDHRLYLALWYQFKLTSHDPYTS